MTSPNILLLMSDEHSFRCLSHLDSQTGEPVHTPHLDKLATSGTTFEQAYCPVPLCTPSRLCLLSGRQAQRCDAWTNNSEIDAAEVPTLPNVLRNNGYVTGLVGKMHLGGRHQFVGFNHRPYGDLTGHAGHQDEPLDPDQHHPNRDKHLLTDVGVTEIPESLLQETNVIRESLSFLRDHQYQNPDRPWFLCASFSRPHFPLTAPRRHFERYWPDKVTEPKVRRTGETTDHPLTLHRARKQCMIKGGEDDTSILTEREILRARAAYFACVDYLDELIGDFLSGLRADGLLDDTIVVYTSDHGELAGEHGLFWKHTWHEASARVPLLIQTPDQRYGEEGPTSVSTPVSLVDLFPTLCGLTGVSPPDGLDGFDLSTAVRTGMEPDRGPVFCDQFAGDSSGSGGANLDFRFVRDGQYKYVQFNDAPEILLDLANDPLEQENLADNPDDEITNVLDRLRVMVDDTVDFDRIEERRERCRRERTSLETRSPRHEEYHLSRKGNEYHFPDGRIMNADLPIYNPDVVLSDPENAYADWPR